MGIHALSTIGATEPPQKCARVDELIGIEHAGHTETSVADGVFCGRDELGSESSRIIDDENTPRETSPIKEATLLNINRCNRGRGMGFGKVAYVEYVPYGQRRPEQRRGKHSRTNYGTLLHSLDD